MHNDLDSLDNFLDSKDPEERPVERPEERSSLPEPPFTNGSLSVVVPMDDFKLILRQMWKSRSEPKMGELYERYTELTTFE